MRFTLDIEPVGNSHSAHITTEGFSLRLTRPTAAEAVARIGQVVAEVMPILESAEPSAIVLDAPDPSPSTVERRVVVDGDSPNMRTLLRDAIAGGYEVKLTYTDREDVQTTRTVKPVNVEWKGVGERPRRALIANDAQADGKTFYLDKIDRAEV